MNNFTPLEFFPVTVMWAHKKEALSYQREFTRKYRSKLSSDLLGRQDNLIFNKGLTKYCKSKNNLGNMGTSQINAYLFSVLTKMFGYPDGLWLDPFAGSFERGIIARDNKMDYLGVDVRENQIEANKKVLEVLGVSSGINYVASDSKKYLNESNISCDFILTCPPYYNLEKYSDNPEDLSTMKTAQFNESIAQIVGLAIDKLKEDRFAVFVTGNSRDNTGRLRQMNHAVITSAEAHGAVFYNELIWIRSYGTASFRAPNMYRKARKLCPTHETFLIFYKGNHKKVKDRYIQKVEREE